MARYVIFDECKISGCKQMSFVTPKYKCHRARHGFRLFLTAQVSISTCEAVCNKSALIHVALQ